MEINPAVTFKHDRSIMYAKRPKVLIVGAGLGGLTLGMLLQKTDIPYEIYERAPEVKPLGAAMYFNGTSAPLFKQCGIYDEFVSFGKFVTNIQVCNEHREVKFKMDFAGEDKRFGANGYIVSRPKIYDLLLHQIPKERIHLGKKVLSMEQGGNGVLLRCSDGSEAEGDILVGADGAYSAVRQNLYAKLKKENKLPASDALPLPFSVVCLVGQTRPLDSSEFPDLALEECQFRNILGDNNPYSVGQKKEELYKKVSEKVDYQPNGHFFFFQWSTFTTQQNTICWGVYQYLDDESSKENDAFRNSEWGPEAAGAMCEKVRDLSIISGGDKRLTIGDLIDWSPKELISKVMLEEKVFKTWFNCRTVLIGDACHKLSPAGGAGAVNAMHDAIVVANLINALPLHPTAEEIHNVFRAYSKERMPWVKEAFESSKLFKIMAEKTFMAKVLRYCSKNMPVWLWHRVQVRMMSNRPQCAYIAPAEDKGAIRPAPQPSLTARAPIDAKKKKDAAKVQASTRPIPV
ncbi:hypothetical protein BGX23_008654 [Mortierella sp. AD031]|nr:hypothetical protein BGX23_008654 [Mortierella sp. AD031]